MCVLDGHWRLPDEKSGTSIDELIQALTDVIEALPDDEDIDGEPGASD